jgi:short-subunit dehydrogenase
LSDGLRAAYAKDGLTITTVSPGVMRTGSHINANFKGQSEKEYQWFGFGATTPGFSSDAEKSAALILDQFYRGRAEVIFPIPMSLFIKFRALFPEVSQGLLTLMNRLLPDPLPGDAGQQTIRGRKLGLIPPVSLTPRLGLEIASRNNEL